MLLLGLLYDDVLAGLISYDDVLAGLISYEDVLAGLLYDETVLAGYMVLAVLLCVVGVWWLLPVNMTDDVLDCELGQ